MDTITEEERRKLEEEIRELAQKYHRSYKGMQYAVDSAFDMLIK